MKSAKIASILVALFVLSSIITVIPVEAKQDNRRVLAFSDEQANNAVNQGCKIVQETRGLKALICNPLVADSLGLQEDIQKIGRAHV